VRRARSCAARACTPASSPSGGAPATPAPCRPRRGRPAARRPTRGTRDAQIARLQKEKAKLEQELAKARFVADVQSKLQALLACDLTLLLAGRFLWRVCFAKF